MGLGFTPPSQADPPRYVRRAVLVVEDADGVVSEVEFDGTAAAVVCEAEVLRPDLAEVMAFGGRERMQLVQDGFEVRLKARPRPNGRTYVLFTQRGGWPPGLGTDDDLVWGR